jgi:hypothetical protein
VEAVAQIQAVAVVPALVMEGLVDYQAAPAVVVL